MSRKKGSEKTGGRAKGTPNKVTSDLKTWIAQVIDANREQFISDLQEIEPYQRVALMEKLIAYIIPKAQQETKQFDINQLFVDIDDGLDD